MMKELDNINLVCKTLQENENINNICTGIGSDITAQRQTIVKFLEDLEPLMVNTDVKLRKLGIVALVQVMEAIPANFLSEQELKFLSLYLCDRIKDHHSFTPVVLQGINVIVGMENLSAQSTTTLCSAIFKNIVCQAQSISDRYIYYSIFQTLFTQRLQDIKPITSEFVLGIISAMDGERHPQNLLLLFNFLPVFLKNVELGQLTEDTFEVIACYFPVDFNPQANDVNAVTREDLAASLGSCLTAIPEFAEFCIPLILEKIESNLRVAKLDSLKLLIDGFKVWEATSLTSHLTDLWLYFKKELLPCSDEQFYKLAISALTALLQRLNNVDLIDVVEDILASCEGLLSDIQLSLFIPAVNLLLVTAQATKTTCRIVASKVVPKLLIILECTPNNRDQVVLLNAISSFMNECLTNFVFSSEGGVLTEAWATWPKVLLQSVQHNSPDVRTESFKAIKTLLPHLQQPIRLQLYPILVTSVTSKQEQSLSVRNICMECLKILARTYPTEVEENLLFQFKIQEDNKEDLVIQERKFEALCFLAVNHSFSEEIKNELFTIIGFLSPLTATCLGCLRRLLENSEPSLDPFFLDFLALSSGLISVLATFWIETMKNLEVDSLFTVEQHLITCASIIDFCVRRSSYSKDLVGDVIQSQLVFTNHLLHISEDETGYLRVTSPPRHTQAVVLLESLVGSLRPEIEPISPSQLENVLLPLAVQSTHSFTQTSAVRLVATVVNKMQESIVSPLLDIVSNCIEENLRSEDKGLKERAVTLHVYVSKALALRGFPAMNSWLQRLITLLDDETVGQEASNGFQFIMQESEHYLNAKSNCIIRLLYRQRVFQIMPKLVSSYHNSTTTTKIHYLTAVAHLMQGVSSVVLVPQLQLIMPLLVESLNMTDAVHLLLTSLQSLGNLLKAREPVLEEHIDTFITRFLKLAQNNQNMKVRIEALQCLYDYLGYSHIRLMPLKQQVLTGLGPCLDDKKRLVRKEAVRTRSNWFLLGAPMEDV